MYGGSRLAAGHMLAGPAVIEERTTTVGVPPGFAGRVDPWKNYTLSRRASQDSVISLAPPMRTRLRRTFYVRGAEGPPEPFFRGPSLRPS